MQEHASELAGLFSVVMRLLENRFLPGLKQRETNALKTFLALANHTLRETTGRFACSHISHAPPPLTKRQVIICRRQPGHSDGVIVRLLLSSSTDHRAMPEPRAFRARSPRRPLRPLACVLLLALSACAQPILPYTAAATGPTSRLLMRGSLEPGEAYGVYLLGGVQDCTLPQRVGTGTSEANPAVTTIAANRLSTLDVVVTKSNQTSCRVRWSFSPRAGRSYLVAARGEPGGCSVSLLDATNPDDIRTELSARRRDAPGNSCVPLSASKTVGELTARSQGLITATDRPTPASRASNSDVVPSAVTEDDLKGLTGSPR